MVHRTMDYCDSFGASQIQEALLAVTVVESHLYYSLTLCETRDSTRENPATPGNERLASHNITPHHLCTPPARRMGVVQPCIPAILYNWAGFSHPDVLRMHTKSKPDWRREAYQGDSPQSVEPCPRVRAYFYMLKQSKLMRWGWATQR